jgi:hypothetical protein
MSILPSYHPIQTLVLHFNSETIVDWEEINACTRLH